jgi:hypothetical protein
MKRADSASRAARSLADREGTSVTLTAPVCPVSLPLCAVMEKSDADSLLADVAPVQAVAVSISNGCH